VCEDQASIQCRDVRKSTKIENKSLSGLGERKGFIIDNLLMIVPDIISIVN